MNNFVRQLKLYGRFALRRLGVPAYQVHQIYLPQKKLLYIPIPKNACTTIKHALHEIEFGQQFTPEKRERLSMVDIHDFYLKRSGAFTGVSRLRRTNATCFAVVRDPVQRLISCYRNRVVDLGDLSESQHVLQKMGLSADPDLNTFVLNLKGYRKANKSIEHHARPQSEFLSGTLDYLDHIFPIEQMDELKSMLKEYGWEYRMRSVKSGGTSFDIGDLSQQALEFAISYYEEDYRLLADYYAPDKIRNRYTSSS